MPADMVVNAMIAAIATHANQTCSQTIYHVGTSVSNPVKFSRIQRCGYRYFTEHPWIGKDGKPVIVGEVTVLSSMASFHRYISLRYLLPLLVCPFIFSFCHFFLTRNQIFGLVVWFRVPLNIFWRFLKVFVLISNSLSLPAMSLVKSCTQQVNCTTSVKNSIEFACWWVYLPSSFARSSNSEKHYHNLYVFTSRDSELIKSTRTFKKRLKYLVES